MNEPFVPLVEAAERSGQLVSRLRRWCATGKLRCDRTGDGWLIPKSEIARIHDVAKGLERAVPITGLAVPAGASANLAARIAALLGRPHHDVSASPLALDGAEYVVAVWRSVPSDAGRWHALHELSQELDGELLDGAIEHDRSGRSS